MGDTKRQRRKYETSRYPWSKAQLDSELRLLGTYGLRNKRELRKHQMVLSGYWTRARQLQAITKGESEKLQKEILSKLQSYALVTEGGNLDNVLDLKIEDVLDRRLQTFVYRLNLSRTPEQARQLITHGHISIGNRKVTSPSYLIKRDEERDIHYAPSSRFSKDDSLIRGQSSVPETNAPSGD